MSNTDSLSSIMSSLASLISSVAWPLVIFLVLISIYRKSDVLIKKVNDLMKGKDSAEISLGLSGITGKIVADKVAKTVIESAEKSLNGSLNVDQIQRINKTAQSAVAALGGHAYPLHQTFKILWVDDHPENNIGLQYAFQTLGLIVISIESNHTLRQAFYTTGGFDVVVTDMHRDGMIGRTEQDPQAGIKTVNMIRESYPGTPTIIYANIYAREHGQDPLESPVVNITNDPQIVFSVITDLARQKIPSTNRLAYDQLKNIRGGV